MAAPKTEQPRVVTGLPYQVDIDRLMERFGVPEEGVTIRYEDVEAVVGLSRCGSPAECSRFRDRTRAWLEHLLRKYNVSLRTVRDVGWVVEDPESRISSSTRTLQQGFRKARKAGALAATTDVSRLSTESRRTRDRLIERTAALKLVHFVQPKALPSAADAMPAIGKKGG